MQFFLSLLQSVSIIIASGMAIYGINAWRREYVGKKRVDLAEDVLAKFYEARDAARMIRSPFGYSDEGESREPRQHETNDEADARKQAHVFRERYQVHQELFSRLYSLRYRFMALFGRESGKPFTDLWKLINEIFIAADEYASMQIRWRKGLLREEDEQRSRELGLTFWEIGGKQDQLSRQLDAVIAEIESICRPIIVRSTQGDIWIRGQFGRAWKRGNAPDAADEARQGQSQSTQE